MKQNSYYNEKENRWYTKLLWKNDPTLLGTNLQKCITILSTVERNAKIKNMQELVNSSFQEMVDNGYAEQVPEKEKLIGNVSLQTDLKTHYIPCHPVYTLHKDTTKVRIVMNCSSKTSSGYSLNDLLYTGPVLLPDFVKVLIKFRTQKYAFSLDISKMFLQIKMSHDGDKNLLRFLWRDCTSSGDPIEYRMTVLVFGSVLSPFQAIWVIWEHAKLHSKEFPLAAMHVLETLYMDDIASCCKEREEAMETVKQIDELFKKASMITHKWASNDPKILNFLPKERLANIDKVKILGQNWDCKNDSLQFRFCELSDKDLDQPDTKRSFLKKSATLFDPIGFLGPFLLVIKLLFQTLWISKINWDDSLPSEVQEKWTKLKKQIPSLNQIKLPRYLLMDKDVLKHYLAIFCDASNQAFASCVYLVTRYTDNTTSTSLLFSKNRVAPIKIHEKAKGMDPLTIVRLELLGMVVGARIGNYIEETIQNKLKIERTFYFTDSQINLCRLKRGYNYYKQWVSSRLKEISSLTKSTSWFFVPTDKNPADLASRGIDVVQQLLISELWWKGPDFLTQPTIKWESMGNTVTKVEKSFADVETRETLLNVMALKFDHTLKIQSPEIYKLMNRFSSWIASISFITFILRFAHHSHKAFRGKNRSIEEDGLTLNFIINKIQEYHFHRT